MRVTTGNQHNYLFLDHVLRDTLDDQERQMYDEVEGIEANRLLNTSVDDLVSYFVEKYTVEPPQLDEENIAVDHKEIKIEVSDDSSRRVCQVFCVSRFHSWGTLPANSMAKQLRAGFQL